MARTSKFKRGGEWHTWIDFPKFLELQERLHRPAPRPPGVTRARAAGGGRCLLCGRLHGQDARLGRLRAWCRPAPHSARPARPAPCASRGRAALRGPCSRGAAPPPSLLLPLPMSLLYTPSVDNKNQKRVRGGAQVTRGGGACGRRRERRRVRPRGTALPPRRLAHHHPGLHAPELGGVEPQGSR